MNVYCVIRHDNHVILYQFAVVYIRSASPRMRVPCGTSRTTFMSHDNFKSSDLIGLPVSEHADSAQPDNHVVLYQFAVVYIRSAGPRMRSGESVRRAAELYIRGRRPRNAILHDKQIPHVALLLQHLPCSPHPSSCTFRHETRRN